MDYLLIIGVLLLAACAAAAVFLKLKKKKGLSLTLIGVSISIIIAFSGYVQQITTAAQGRYNDLSIEKDKSDDKVKDLESRIKEINENVDYNTYIANRDRFDKEIETKEIEVEEKKIDIETLSGNIKDLKKEIKEKKAEIKSLDGQIVKAQGKPKKFPAGNFTAGDDFPTGRYRISNGSSNFFVRNSSGRLKVNIILGTRQYTVSEYIYEFNNGDKVEANSTFTLTLVE